MAKAGSSFVARLLGAPALHFAAAGALLFLASGAMDRASPTGSSVDEASRLIVVDAARIRGLKRDYTLASGSLATDAEVRTLIDKLVTEEILFREGIARGFEQGDRAIAWRLVQKMRYLGEDHGDDVGTLYRRALEMGLHLSDPVVRQVLVEKVRLVVGWAAPPPTEQELAQWYAQHGADFGQAARVTLRHAYFDRARRGVDGARRAAEEAVRDAAGHGAEALSTLGGDPFLMGKRLVAQGPVDLDKFFGPAFSKQVLSLEAGTWQGPIESAYGWHAVFVEERFDPRIPDLAEVRSRAEKSYENSRRAVRVTEYLQSVRPGYTVRIDESAIGGGADD